MYPTHIDEIARAVAEALGLDEKQARAARKAVAGYWRGRAAIVVTRLDIAEVCERNGWRWPTDRQCDDVLDALMEHADGVTTETVERALRAAGLAVKK